MDKITAANFAEVRGIMAAAPAFSHESRGERFYTFPIETRRLSGASDIINVTARQSVMERTELKEAERLRITGELRSFNNKSGVGARLVIFLFPREIVPEDGADKNEVELTGTLCKKPNLRVTPMGREICDLMLAVGRRCGRSDYLPCICWGSRAREASMLDTGDIVSLSGRIQSREYIKLIDALPVRKTAYEVSVSELRRPEE